MTPEEERETQRAYVRAYQKANWQAHKEGRLTRNPARWHPKVKESKKMGVLKKKYGLTQKRYKELLDACGGQCPVCLNPFGTKGARRPCVDHCHGTGLIRGVLCNSCNAAEGLMSTPVAALRLYEYMNKNELFYLAPKQPDTKLRKPRKRNPKEPALNVISLVAA